MNDTIENKSHYNREFVSKNIMVGKYRRNYLFANLKTLRIMEQEPRIRDESETLQLINLFFSFQHIK